MAHKRQILLLVGSLMIFGSCASNARPEEAGTGKLPAPPSTREQAVQLARTGELRRALELIEQALVETDRDPKVVADYIVILSWNGKWERAIAVFEGISDPKTLPAYVLPEVARCYRMTGDYEQAVSLYERCLKDSPLDYEIFKGLIYTLLDAGQIEEARERVEKRLDEDPRDIIILFLKGEILEDQQEYIQAVAVYDQILSIYPKSQKAGDFKVRALLDLGAVSLAREEIEAAESAVDPDLRRRAKGDAAMYRIRWNEPEAALEELTTETSPPEEEQAVPVGKPDSLRARWDRITALRARFRMEEVIAEYEELCAQSQEIPYWVHQAAADAYLHLEKPKDALLIYRLVVREQPEAYSARMALFYTLVELRRFREATAVLDALDQDTPAQIVERGILKENWKKAEIAYARSWLLMYQDKLKEAGKYLEEITLQAPFNTNLRNARAHNYFWRGWPRLAREEFEVIHVLDPENPAAANGYCIILNVHDRKEETRQLIQELCRRHPGNKHIQRTYRQFEIEDMRRLTIDASFTEEHPGAEEVYFSIRVDNPLSWRHTLFAELVRQDTKQPGERDREDRFYLGVDWERSPVLRLTGAISTEYDQGENFGWLLRGSYAPNDYLSFSAGYETEILGIPLHSRVTEVDGTETTLSGTYRASELFSTTAGASLRNLSDGNETWSYLWTTNTGITTRAWWKTRLLTEAYASANSRTDVSYFSPARRHSFYLIPMVEHTWYRWYQRELRDRLYLGIGRQYQKHFSSQSIWFIRYEQDYKLSDTRSWLIGTQYSQRNYDAEDVNELVVYTRLIKHF